MSDMTDFERSHAKLRAVVRLAGIEIRKLNLGTGATPLLRFMRRTLREAQQTAKRRYSEDRGLDACGKSKCNRAYNGDVVSYPPMLAALKIAPGGSFRDAVIERAIEVIGDRDEALRWLGTPVRALNYAMPISKLGDEAGAAEVLAVLNQLEQGVW
jgi:Protein of unknown function (DUF2384)